MNELSKMATDRQRLNAVLRTAASSSAVVDVCSVQCCQAVIATVCRVAGNLCVALRVFRADPVPKLPVVQYGVWWLGT